MTLFCSDQTPRCLVGLWFAVVLIVAFRARRRGLARVLCILAVGVEIGRFVNDLGVWGMLAACTIGRGSLAATDGIAFARTAWYEGGTILPLHRVSLALVALAVVVRVWQWRRGLRPKVHEVLSLVGAWLLSIGLYASYDRLEDQTIWEVLALHGGWPLSEWVWVEEAWPVRGLDGEHITTIARSGPNGDPRAVAITEGGSVYRVDLWERDGVAFGPMPLGVRSLQFMLEGGCVSWVNGRGRCWFDGRGAAALPELGDVPIMDMQIASRVDKIWICVLFADHTDRCWEGNPYTRQPFRSLAARADVVAQSARPTRRPCLLYEDGHVGCRIERYTHELSPVGQVEGVTRATKLVGVEGQTCALQADGEVNCWDKPVNEASRRGTEAPRFVAEREPMPAPVKDIDMNEGLCAVTRLGEVICRHYTRDDPIPRYATIPGIHDAVRVFEGPTSCAAHAAGGLSCWGYRRRYAAARRLVRGRLFEAQLP